MAVNNTEHEAALEVDANAARYVGLLGGTKLLATGGKLHITLPACGGEIFAPEEDGAVIIDPEVARLFKERQEAEQRAVEEARKQAAARAEAQGAADLTAVAIPNVALEDMTVEQLQAVILAKMAKNGPVNDQMHRDVEANIWHDSLVNWAKSFR